MQRRLTAVLVREGDGYVAHCVELGVTSQGDTIEDARANLKEAAELYLESFEDDDLPEDTEEVVLSSLEVRVPEKVAASA